MTETNPTDAGPDLTLGVPVDRLKEGEPFRGQVNGEPVILVRRGAVFHAVGATCSHYSGPLEAGLVSGDTVHCPWHHACFDLHTGRAIRAPGLSPIPVYDVARRLDLIVVTGRRAPDGPAAQPAARAAALPGPSRIVIVGAGAAGSAAAVTLREEGFRGTIVLIGAESETPYDRPNLSKDYLAGTAPEDWLPLRPRETYEQQEIRLVLGTPAARVAPTEQMVYLEDGRAIAYDGLLLATGATPIRPPIPGIDAPHVHTLRSLADSRAIMRAALESEQAVVIGAGFLGLEVAGSLRARGVRVHVVAPDQRPLERILGPALGTHIQRLHEERGVAFHLRRSVTAIEPEAVRLDDGATIAARLVVVATGVRPDTGIAARMGLVLDHGVVVDRQLESSIRGVFAAGDAVRWPDSLSGELTGCGHWSLAGRMGQTAARNLLGFREPFLAAPFFWSQHYDLRISCTGNTDGVDRIEVTPGLPPAEWEQRHYRGDRMVALTTFGRDRQSLEGELALERQMTHRPVHA